MRWRVVDADRLEELARQPPSEDRGRYTEVVPQQARDLLERIARLVELPEADDRLLHSLRVRVADVFAAELGLGIPQAMLPADALRIDGMGPDALLADRSSSAFAACVRHNGLPSGAAVHTVTFHQLLPLPGGHRLAWPTACGHVIWTVEGGEIHDLGHLTPALGSLGLAMSRHDGWCWEPAEAGSGLAASLVLLRQVSAGTGLAQAFQGSFRQWIIGHRADLRRRVPQVAPRVLSRAVQMAVEGACFPLQLDCAQGLRENFMEPHFVDNEGLLIDDAEGTKGSFQRILADELHDAFEALFSQWRSDRTGLC